MSGVVGIVQVLDAYALIEGSSTLEDLYRNAERVFSEYGFDGFYYYNYAPSAGLHKIDGRPKEWIERYEQYEYLNTDPVTHRAISSPYPFLWEESLQGLKLTQSQRRVFDEAREFGLKNGFNIPIHGGGLDRASLCLFSSELSDFHDGIRKSKTELLMIGYAVHSTYLKLTNYKKEIPHLSSRERECLLWVAKGKTNDEIAMILAISAETVKQYLKAASEKLNTRTRTQAVVEAIKLYLIIP